MQTTQPSTAAQRIDALRQALSEHQGLNAGDPTTIVQSIPDAIQEMMDAVDRVTEFAMLLLCTKDLHPQIHANANVTLAAITGQLNRFLLNPTVNVIAG